MVIDVIEISKDGKCANVRWKIVNANGTFTYHRKAYSVEQKAEFLAEVEGAADYIPVLGW